MVYTGRVENGVIVLAENVVLPEGAEVTVQLAEGEEQRPVSERFPGLVGQARELPTDLAEQHDHYLHGAPRR